MKFCSHCGQQVDDKAVVCVKCGCAIEDIDSQRNAVAKDDAPSTGLAVLSFFFPLIGLILYLVFKDTHPKKAKSIGKGALAGFITGVVLSIIYAIIVGVAVGTGISSIYY